VRQRRYRGRLLGPSAADNTALRRRGPAPQRGWRTGSSIALPIADQVADLIISHGVTHHTMDPLRCFSETVRILRPGGRLFYAVYNCDNLYRSLYLFLSSPLKAVRRPLGQQLADAAIKCPPSSRTTSLSVADLRPLQKRWSVPALRDSWEQFGDSPWRRSLALMPTSCKPSQMSLTRTSWNRTPVVARLPTASPTSCGTRSPAITELPAGRRADAPGPERRGLQHAGAKGRSTRRHAREPSSTRAAKTIEATAAYRQLPADWLRTCSNYLSPHLDDRP
jgi:hypothetical protein